MKREGQWRCVELNAEVGGVFEEMVFGDDDGYRAGVDRGVEEGGCAGEEDRGGM